MHGNANIYIYNTVSYIHTDTDRGMVYDSQMALGLRFKHYTMRLETLSPRNVDYSDVASACFHPSANLSSCFSWWLK